ncbi:unnamed protein product [Pleuronectes platessa]|uniref:Uncharacterized protein n=1 Tax=Pleuronectes platessa TaxID=8262 RepID=A0A9N7U460_PLEPL|nr:unnamed protein product [Pleuronectes platessa]
MSIERGNLEERNRNKELGACVRTTGTNNTAGFTPSPPDANEPWTGEGDPNPPVHGAARTTSISPPASLHLLAKRMLARGVRTPGELQPKRAPSRASLAG